MKSDKQPVNIGIALKKALKWFFNSFIWVGLVFLAIDIVTKLVFYKLLFNPVTETSEYYQIIPGFLRISVTLNPNAAFGLGFDDPVLSRVMFIIVYLIGLAIITGIYVVKHNKLPKLVKICLVMLAAGALGNLIDRLFYGFTDYQVIDWIDFHGVWKFIFNIADTCVVVGTIILIVWLIVDEVKDIKAKKALETKGSKVLSEDEKARIEKVVPEEDIDEDTTDERMD
jgi:signal peptidase II